MDSFQVSITVLLSYAYSQSNNMEHFTELIEPKSRERTLLKIADLYAAEAVTIFIKDPETHAYIPAPGLPQTIKNGKAWQEILQSKIGRNPTDKTLSLPVPGEKQMATLIASTGSIVFAVLGGCVSREQDDSIRKILPFLLKIFLYERREQYSEIRITAAEQSVAENKHIASKLDITRRELHKALVKTREEMQAAKRAQEFKNRVDSLTKQRNNLIRLNEIKDEFISVASHQLRTPATVSKQYMALLREGYAGELTTNQLQYLQIAYESNETQLSILNNLLKTAQLDTTGLALRKKKMSLIQLVEGVISQLSTTISLRKQMVLFEYSKEDVIAPVNEEEIKLVLINLLENASKYTAPGKKIVVKLSSDDTHAIIAIKDEGVGIGEKDMEKIFEKFTRVDNELSHTVSGSGLGLYMVKRIVDLHDGQIDVVSVVDEGSLFTVKLPL